MTEVIDIKKAGANYAAPLVAMDEIIGMNKESLRTIKRIHKDEPYFAGHYPGNPIYPGVFIFEAVHQGILNYGEKYFGGLKLKRIKSVRFHAPVQPGDVLETESKIGTSEAEQTILIDCICTCADTRVAKIKLIYEKAMGGNT